MRRSRLVRNWLSYAFLWLLCFLLWQSVDGYVYYVFVLALSVLPLLSLGLVFIAKTRFQLSLEDDSLHLPGWLLWLCSGIEITVHKHHIFFGRKDEEVLTLTQAQTKLSCGYAGIWNLTIQRVRLQDVLGLFWLHPSVKNGWSIQVLKQTGSLPADMIRRFENYLAQGKEDEHLPSGDYEIRSYREGDSLHHIHYKISSKFQQLMVKEYEVEQAEAPTVFLAFPTDIDDCDAYLQTVYALCQTHLPLRLLWQTQEGLNSQLMESREQVLSAFIKLYQTAKPTVSASSSQAFRPLDEEVLYG